MGKLQYFAAALVAAWCLTVNGCDAKPKTPEARFSTDVDACSAELDRGWFDAPEVERKRRAVAWNACISAAVDARDRRTNDLITETP